MKKIPRAQKNSSQFFHNYLLNQEIKFVGPQWNKGGGFLYVLTLMHMLHLFGGMIALTVALFKAKRNRYSIKNYYV